MPNPYAVLYRAGITPWDGKTAVGPLLQVLDGRGPGRALDAGCGTGRHAVLMAQRGWNVTGVDAVEKPLRAARERARAAAVSERTNFLKGDVARLDAVLPGRTFDLVLDAGCLHGLPSARQRAFASWVTEHTGDGATVLLLAAMPRRGIGPKGIDQPRIADLFGPPWSFVPLADDQQAGVGPLRAAAFRWYQLSR